MARLSAAHRRALPRSDFAVPEKAPGPGSYPIEDKGHAQAALGEVEAHGTTSEKRRVRSAVARKYPRWALHRAGH
jgi:hypothetical protein